MKAKGKGGVNFITFFSKLSWLAGWLAGWLVEQRLGHLNSHIGYNATISQQPSFTIAGPLYISTPIKTPVLPIKIYTPEGPTFSSFIDDGI